MQTTARDIVTPALKLIGVIAANETGNSADLATALATLNDMVDAWSINPDNLLSDVTETFSFVPGQATYTIGVGGNFNTAIPMKMTEASFVRYQLVDFPLREIDADTYSAYPYKPTGGIPETFYFNPGTTLASVSFYPVPQTGMTIELHTLKPMNSFTGLDTAYQVSPGYKDALKYSLAESLCSIFEREIPKFVAVQAIKMRRSLKRSNVVVPTMDINFVPAGLGGDTTYRVYP